METVKIRVRVKFEDCQESGLGERCEYVNGAICPLNRAISRRLKKGFSTNIGSVGWYDIYQRVDDYRKSIFSGQVKNFNMYTVRGAKHDFFREVELPVECVLKRARKKEKTLK